MSVNPGGWAIPDFGMVHLRARVCQLLSQSGTKPCVVFGPSGAGKSVAVAQHCSGGERPAIWIDASGDVLSLDRIAGAAVAALGQSSLLAESESEHLQSADYVAALMAGVGAAAECGVDIIVDDLGTEDGANTTELSALARALRSCSSRLFVTTRSVAHWPAEVLCSWALVGPDDLALTSEEAVGLIEAAGLGSLTSQAEELRDACDGRVAIFAVLASQAAKYGVKSAVERTVSLEAWMRQLIRVHARSGVTSCLVAAGLLATGDASDLAAMHVENPSRELRCIADSLPLLRQSRAGGESSFRVHDLLSDFILDELQSGRLSIDEATIEAAIERLSLRGETARIIEILTRLSTAEARARWLEASGQTALSSAAYTQLDSLLKSLPIHVLMARPRVLMLWADLCCELGQAEEAYAKCQAVRSLAEHSGDPDTLRRALSLSMQSLCRLYRFDEAEVLSREILESPQWRSELGMRGEALMCLARAKLTRGEDAADTADILAEAVELTSGSAATSRTQYTLTFLSALVPILSEGDWMAGALLLSPLMLVSGQLVSSRIMAMGNLGLMLTEAGRLTRSQALLRSAVSEARRFELDGYVGAYAPPLGYATVGAGAIGEGLSLIREGIEISLGLGDATEAATDRVHYSTVLRSIGRPEEALAEAEQAFEVLSPSDNIGFRRLAAIEIAASLLALDDLAAATRWIDSVALGGPNLNPYHLLRADIVAALVDWRRGDTQIAVGRLAAHCTHIASGNSNWQAAMYCRAFPELLGLLALAVGVEHLPSHMLRMVLPEHAEAALEESRSLLPAAEWRTLGRRLIGPKEFAELESRGGLQLCHVRMFGGLQVSIGGRAVRERDWRKRKARLLFCMLVVRNGQDVARDRLFEHLWPEMDEEHAKGNMYVIWSAIKSALTEVTDGRKSKCPYVESLGGVCRSVREYVRTDVSAFELALAEGRQAEAAGATDAAIAAYKRLTDIYQGDLLPGDLYDDWFAGVRDHYRLEFIDAMARASRIHLSEGDPHTGLMCARRALQQDPAREDLYQAVLRCQIGAGQRSSAIDTYMQCKARLSEELGLDPSPETRALYGEILALEDSAGPSTYDPLAD